MAALKGQTVQAKTKRGHVLRDKANVITFGDSSEDYLCVHCTILTFW